MSYRLWGGWAFYAVGNNKVVNIKQNHTKPSLTHFLLSPQKFPGYREEKKHCEYLHEKLSYIKQLIVDYDVAKASS